MKTFEHATPFTLTPNHLTLGMASTECKFAVVTVPSGFSERQREAVKAAGKMAGLTLALKPLTLTLDTLNPEP